MHEVIEFQKQHLAFLGGRLSAFESFGFGHVLSDSAVAVAGSAAAGVKHSNDTSETAAILAGSAAAGVGKQIGSLSAAISAGSAAACVRAPRVEFHSYNIPMSDVSTTVSIKLDGPLSAFNTSAAAEVCILDQHGVPAAISAGFRCCSRNG